MPTTSSSTSTTTSTTTSTSSSSSSFRYCAPSTSRCSRDTSTTAVCCSMKISYVLFYLAAVLYTLSLLPHHADCVPLDTTAPPPQTPTTSQMLPHHHHHHNHHNQPHHNNHVTRQNVEASRHTAQDDASSRTSQSQQQDFSATWRLIRRLLYGINTLETLDEQSASQEPLDESSIASIIIQALLQDTPAFNTDDQVEIGSSANAEFPATRHHHGRSGHKRRRTKRHYLGARSRTQITVNGIPFFKLDKYHCCKHTIEESYVPGYHGDFSTHTCTIVPACVSFCPGCSCNIEYTSYDFLPHERILGQTIQVETTFGCIFHNPRR